MTDASDSSRTDSASKMIHASPEAIYRAFLDPQALVSWLPPEGMTGEIDNFDPREGGGCRMTLRYNDADHSTPGKTSEHSDIVDCRYLELVPDKRIVQSVNFASDDPAFAGTMRMTWSLNIVPGGTEVTIVCENVPSGIAKEDHDQGLKSTLENLADYVEKSTRADPGLGF
ncbi:MAG: SRPBCC family protein [Rhizobiaceae bacterium]|nr:SRPBCC family protein [Rhizobiaceae bacterium]